MVLFVENVVGFETSDTHTKMIEILGRTNFVLQEFILSLLQFGVPYSRSRYFCLAKRKPSTFYNQVFDNQLLCSLGPLFWDANADETVFSELDEPQESRDTLLESCEPIESFLEFKNCSDQLESDFGDTTTGSTNTEGILDKDEGNGYCSGIVDQYIVPLSLVERWGSAMDIVYPDSKRCCCFTKCYYLYVKGTGSLLATLQPKNKDKASSLKEQHLRYFTPREFPQRISLRQRCALRGNSFEYSSGCSVTQILICRIIVIILKTLQCSRCRSHPQLYVWLTISTTIRLAHYINH
ncbi:hypothetical protein ACFX2A_044702 [Malus domestica]